MTHFIPAWEDSKKNRFFVVAENHVFPTRDAAVEFQISNCLHYIPFGWTTSGIAEIDLKGTAGEIAHLSATGPFGLSLAIIGGPSFDAATRDEATSPEEGNS